MFALFDNSTKEDVADFAGGFQLTFPVGKENGIAKAVGAKGLSDIVVFISRDGELIKVVGGPISYAALSAGIEEILE